MRSIHRHRPAAGAVLALALALALGTVGCDAIDPSPATLRAGFDTHDGGLEIWPARGRLMDDPQSTARVTAAVSAWRTPTGDRAHLASSGILWLGQTEGASLALVAATVPGGNASWLLQLSEQGSRFEVARAAEHPDPGYLVYSDVLPVYLSSGRRYLTSARVEQLRGPKGDELPLDDGLSARADVADCRAAPVTATLRRTESLPRGKRTDRMVDLGTAVADLRYALIRDESGSGARALDGLNTCRLAERTGPFSSIPRRDANGDMIDGMPMSWPLDQISARSLGEVTVGGNPPARLDQLQWRTDAGNMSAVVYRPPSGTPGFSRADRANALQRYVVPAKPQPLVVLVWQPGPDTSLSLPPRAAPLVEQPGVVVLPKAPGKQSYSLSSPHRTHHRTAAARGVTADRPDRAGPGGGGAALRDIAPR
ncbi:MAG TPA: hypothetical protein VFX60_16495 [Micromonospora sp.]|nr:hypothetical protein [Micromonospora sp.]